MKRFRILLDILVVAMLLMVSIAGCMNGSQTDVETTASISESSISDVSETEVTTTTEKETTATTTVDLFAPDPTYEEAAAHVRDLFAEGNTAEQVIAILMEEGRTEFDATALVNSVLMEDEGTNSGSGTSSGSNSGSSGSDSNNSSENTGETTAAAAGSNSGQTTAPTSDGTASGSKETTAAPAQTNSNNAAETTPAATATPTPTPTSTPVPTKVKQTVYMRINWSDTAIETMAAQGIDLNAERPEAVGYEIMACDANGNYSAATTIDRSDADAARDQMYAEADAILAKYNLTGLDAIYTYSVYKYENEYLYD